jgi:hypothetical protein
MKERKWTDDDVARMLGCKPAEVNDLGQYFIVPWNDGYYVRSPAFGLSTPPGPEADGHAARYVLPWLAKQSLEYKQEVFNRLSNIFPLSRNIAVSLLFYCYDEPEANKPFGPTLCRAALEAWSDTQGR